MSSLEDVKKTIRYLRSELRKMRHTEILMLTKIIPSLEIQSLPVDFYSDKNAEYCIESLKKHFLTKDGKVNIGAIIGMILSLLQEFSRKIEDLEAQLEELSERVKILEEGI